MKRTIEVRDDDAYYGGSKLDTMTCTLVRHFKLRNSRVYKYVITIVEGTRYAFAADGEDYYIYSSKGDRYCGLVCKKYFTRLFFVPGKNKRYDITVKRVRK